MLTLKSDLNFDVWVFYNYEKENFFRIITAENKKQIFTFFSFMVNAIFWCISPIFWNY